MIADSFTTSVIDVAEFKNDHEKFLKVDFDAIFNLLKKFFPFSTNPQTPASTKPTPSEREFNSASFDTSHAMRSHALVEI